MAKPPLRNVAASVRDRLTRQAAERKENVQLVLTRYAIERLLYRLSISPHRDQFVLKGAMLFSLWAPVPYRATGDLDLLGYGDPTPSRVGDVFRGICAIDGEDGVIFHPHTVQAEAARPEDEYSGARIAVTAEIAGARLPVRIDIGFGDVVTPATQDIDYPSLLEMPAPRLRAYPPETVVAEKFQAMVALGMSNSRMKDFFDLWAISETFAFDGTVLAEAIRATFARRQTLLPDQAPVALTPVFSADPAKQAQWQGFLRRTAVTMAPEPLPVLLETVANFVLPPTFAMAAGIAFDRKWLPSTAWR